MLKHLVKETSDICCEYVCGIFSPKNLNEVNTAVAGFLLYLEVLNVQMSDLIQPALAYDSNCRTCVAVDAD